MQTVARAGEGAAGQAVLCADAAIVIAGAVLAAGVSRRSRASKGRAQGERHMAESLKRKGAGRDAPSGRREVALVILPNRVDL